MMKNFNVVNTIESLTLLELPFNQPITETAIRKNYRQLCRVYHPDISRTERYKDGERFKDLLDAQDYLLNNIDGVNGQIRTHFSQNYCQHSSNSTNNYQREEARRRAEEEKRKEEARRKAEEERQKEEARRKAEEERQKEEARRRAEEERQKEEARCKAEEERQKEEARRRSEEERQKEEARRRSEEKETINKSNSSIMLALVRLVIIVLIIVIPIDNEPSDSFKTKVYEATPLTTVNPIFEEAQSAYAQKHYPYLLFIEKSQIPPNGLQQNEEYKLPETYKLYGKENISYYENDEGYGIIVDVTDINDVPVSIICNNISSTEYEEIIQSTNCYSLLRDVLEKNDYEVIKN